MISKYRRKSKWQGQQYRLVKYFQENFWRREQIFGEKKNECYNRSVTSADFLFWYLFPFLFYFKIKQ